MNDLDNNFSNYEALTSHGNRFDRRQLAKECNANLPEFDMGNQSSPSNRRHNDSGCPRHDSKDHNDQPQAGRGRTRVIVDTREQLPYQFNVPHVDSISRALSAGDYSIEGLEDRVAVERKTLEDFIKSVTHGRKRFFFEMQKLAAYDYPCIVVEANLEDILWGEYRGKVHPNALLGTIVSISVDFEVPVFFCSDRQSALRFTLKFLERAKNALGVA